MLQLIQFEFSHFNEKGRWILDYKRLPYEKRSLLPGFHIPTVMLKTGQKSTPVLATDDEIICGTDRIAAFAEAHGDGPPLYPSDETARAKALEIEERFDAVGHAARRIFFAELFRDAAAARDCMIGTAEGFATSVYRASFWLLKHAILMDAGATNAALLEEGTKQTEEALDFVAAESAATGYLVGDHFTIADLTAAALLVPAVRSPLAQIPFPSGYDSITKWFDRYDAHPGAAWVRTMFERHRETDGGRAE